MRTKTISKAISAALSAAMLVTSLPGAALAAPADSPKAADGDQNLLKLRYDEPVSKGTPTSNAGAGRSEEDNIWQQLTLPIGNSFMGANIYGEIGTERLTFNQKTLWNGGPSALRSDYNGGNSNKADKYQEIVSTFLSGDDATASSLCDQHLTGTSNGYGAYQSWGDIYLAFDGLTESTATTGYERGLDLTTGIANVDFTAAGTEYHREYFISYPDNVLAMKLTADGAKSLDFNVSFPVDNGEKSEVQNNLNRKLGKENVTYTADAAAGTIVMKGNQQDNQMKLNSVLQVVTDNKGTVAKGSDNESLDISGANEVMIFISANTDYKNDYPKYRTGETDEQLAARVKKTVDNAVAKGYEKVKERHLIDYKELFGRVDLDLGQAATDKTTDDLLRAYNSTGADAASDSEKRLLEVLLYQFGRYLTIASSREGDLPSNLQGVWQNGVGDHNRIAWACDYHMNVNLQMNYWPTYSANLAECAIPLIDYVDSLREPGRVTAKSYYGIESKPGEANGFTAHTQNTPFGWTCPGWAFSWGWSPAAVPWILQNCWEYYEYTGDLEYMKNRIYPMMKEETILYDQILVDSGQEITLPDGTKSTRLVSVPSYSPELGPYTMGNVYENGLIWQLYEDTITAAELLGVDADLVKRWKSTRDRLDPIVIGDSGQIKEWYHETTIGSVANMSGHRHMSHLLELFPGDYISVEDEDMIDAAVVSLLDRTDSATGWGMGQRINAWARTGDGNHAHVLVQNLFKQGIYQNLWDTHSPFQIDGNFGYTSGINEMLMQSNVGYINILPAIPDVWESGSVNGIVARGNFELEIDWSDGKATEVRILSKNGGECIVQCTGVEKATITDSKGRKVTSDAVEGKGNRIKFNTVKGETYTIANLSEETKLEAPANTAAVKSDASGTTLTWDAVSGADSYNVYSKVGKTTKKLNESNVTATTFKDTASYDDVSMVDYMVAAVKDGKEGFRSDSFKPLPLIYPNKVEVIDETDSRVKYTGNWGSWSDAANYGGSVKFVETAVGDEAVELQFYGTKVEIIAGTGANDSKYNKNWKVYVDGAQAGTANGGGGAAKQQIIYTKSGLSKEVHTVKLVTEGNVGGKIDFDAFVVYGSDDAMVDVTYDLNGATGTAPAAQSGAARSTIQLAACDVPGFQCWTDGSNNYQAGADYILHKDVTMTAVIGTGEANTSDEYLPISVPKSQWTATAGSEANSGTDGPAASAIDGKENTWWHSNYSGNNEPTFGANGTNNEFTIDFGTAVDIDMFEYVPRSASGANGFITQYEILYSASADGDFTKAAEGTWENNTNHKQAAFSSTLQGVRRIQIKALATTGSTANRYIHAAEFNVYMKNPNYDPTAVPTGITVTSDTITLERGESRSLGAAIVPDRATDKNMTYKSSDIMVASVSPNGVVMASQYKSGNATITITSTAVPTVTKTVTVNVKDPEVVEVTSIKLEKERIVLKVGEETSVAANIEPYFGTDKTVTWTSSDSAKASVTNGKITAVAEGEATITASTANNKSASCKVIVVSEVITANKTELSSTIAQFKSQYGDLKQYTKESAEAYLEALGEAEQLLAYGQDVLQTEIDAALTKLQTAADGLAKAEGVNKDWLEEELEKAKAKAKDLSGYSSESAKKFTDAIAAAEAIVAKSNATQSEVDDALGTLQLASVSLKEKPENPDDPKNPDNSDLKNKIQELEAKYTASELDKYSSKVKEAFETAINAAKDVANNPNATQEQIEEAMTALKAAISDLDKMIEQEAGNVQIDSILSDAKDAYAAGSDSYASGCWDAFKEAYEALQNADNNLSAAALKQLADKLQETQAALELSEQRKEAISNAIAEEKKLVDKGNTANYSMTAWNAYVTAYNELKTAEGTEGTGAAKLIQLQKALETAKSELTVDTEWVNAKSALTKALTDAKAAYMAGASKYTAATWNPFKTAYDSANAKANATIANSEAADLSKLAKDLNNARTALKENATAPALKAGDYMDKGGIRYTVIDADKKTASVEGIASQKKKLKKVSIPATVSINGETCTVTEVKAKGFSKFAKITQVTIGSNVTKIGDNSFNGCTSMTKLTVNGTGKIAFGKQSFNGCKKLNTITLKTKQVPSFGKKAFAKTNSKGVKVKFAKGMKPKDKNKMKTLFKKAGIKKVK